jgi:DNA-binding CsgD family transcriptional regulator
MICGGSLHISVKAKGSLGAFGKVASITYEGLRITACSLIIYVWWIQENSGMEHLQIFSYIVILITAGAAIAYIAITDLGHRFPFLRPLMFFVLFWNLKTLVYLFIYYYQINLSAEEAVFEQTFLFNAGNTHNVLLFFFATFAMIHAIRKLDDLVFPASLRLVLSCVAVLSVLLYGARILDTVQDSSRSWLRDAGIPGYFVWTYYGINMFFLAWLLIRSRDEDRLYKKRINRSFGAFYLLLFGGLISTNFLTMPWHMIGILTGKVLMNLFPIIWIRKYLLKYGRSVPLTLDGSQLKAIAGEHGITPRELEIVELILKGRSNKQIADHLCIAHHTVKNHLYRLYQKMGVETRHELVTFFLNHKPNRTESSS